MGVGVADLPLHGGRVPLWMIRYMERMAAAIARAIVDVHGPEALVRGLSDPVWFQAFNNVIGMDWDSSGSTTVLTAVLKRVSWESEDLQFLVLGGKGGRMRLVSEEAREAERRLGVDARLIERFSRAAARIDSALLQDGYEVYHHAVFVASEKAIVVVQQGMNAERGMARRYHVDRLAVEEPHSGVAGSPENSVVNVTARESRDARRFFVDLVGEGARRLKKLIAEANRLVEGRPTLLDFTGNRPNKPLEKPAYYRPVKIDSRLEKALIELERHGLASEEDLLDAPGVTPKVVRALALVADLIYSIPTSTRDPVTAPLNPFAYAYAVGGKDGVPYKYSRETVERVTLTLEEAIEAARLGDREKIRALKRLRSLLRSYLGVEG